MGWITNIIIFLVRGYYMKKATSELKKTTTLMYLKALQIARKSLTGAILLFCTLQLIIFGFVGTVITTVILIPDDFEKKVWILFGVSLAFFVIPMIALVFLLSEKVWFKASGAEELLKQ